jgi:membrane protein implicated in regulation of membrane protease activity
MQSRLHSILEVAANMLIGYTVAVGSQLIIFPMFDVHIPLTSNMLMGLYFMAVSILRSYLLRRWFTRKTERNLRSLALKGSPQSQ